MNPKPVDNNLWHDKHGIYHFTHFVSLHNLKYMENGATRVLNCRPNEEISVRQHTPPVGLFYTIDNIPAQWLCYACAQAFDAVTDNKRTT